MPTLRRVNIFALDLVMFPIHHKVDKKDHWGLAIVNFGLNCIQYYDSLVMHKNHEHLYGSKVRSGLSNVNKFLEEEYLRRYKTSFCTKMNTVVVSPLPQQWNNTDCGVFLLWFAKKIAANDYDMCNTEGHLPRFRQEIRESVISSCR